MISSFFSVFELKGWMITNCLILVMLLGMLSLGYNTMDRATSTSLVMPVKEYIFYSYVTVMHSMVLEAISQLPFGGSSSMAWGTMSYISIISFMMALLFSVNILGLMPFLYSWTSLVQGTMFCSLVCILAVTILSMSMNGMYFFAQFCPSNCLMALTPFLVMMETLSYLMSVFSLGVSLAANVTAGHMMLGVFTSFYVKYSVSCSSFGSLNTLMMMWMVYTIILALELCVCAMQSYVFCMLAVLYMGEQVC